MQQLVPFLVPRRGTNMLPCPARVAIAIQSVVIGCVMKPSIFIG